MYKEDEELVTALLQRVNYIIEPTLVKLLQTAAHRIEVLSNSAQLEQRGK